MIFGSILENLESEKQGLETLLKDEYHPRQIQYLLDKLDNVNCRIRKEKRQHIA